MTKFSEILNLNNKIILYSFYYFILLSLFNNIIIPTNALVNVEPTILTNSDQQFSSSGIKSYSDGVGSTSNVAGTHNLDNLDNLERSLAEVLIKVAYGTTLTTKRSIPDQQFVPSLTTAATPLLTTFRYFEKTPHQPHTNFYHHRNYELDLEKDHALPTSAPIADILKSNRNPTYPNPNRNYERDRHRQFLNSTPAPLIHNFYKKGPTIPMYSSDMLSFSRTPPLPREYENPFNDKPILRGTSNDAAIINNSGGGGSSYINRRPIPPPSIMPGQERIPFRPPELGGHNDDRTNDIPETQNVSTGSGVPSVNNTISQENGLQTPKKYLNTPTQKGFIDGQYNDEGLNINNNSTIDTTNDNINKKNSGNFHIPNISRILSGSNGKKENIPDVLFQQVITNQSQINENENNNITNIKENKYIENIKSTNNQYENSFQDNKNNDNDKFNDDPSKIAISSIPSELPVTNVDNNIKNNESIAQNTTDKKYDKNNSDDEKIKNHDKNFVGGTSSSSSSSSSSSTGGGTIETTTWNIAWNIHIYLSVILFTILGVYFIFKIIFYNQLTHLFNQSYFLFIHLILIFICILRIFYLIYDAYNIHLTFNTFISELLLNIPLILLLITFLILILYLLIHSINLKNNRYSIILRPLTILIGSSILIGLCITLHYVENYTTKKFYNQQQKLYLNNNNNNNNGNNGNLINLSSKNNLLLQSPPPRVLSLIYQIIFIIVCLIFGLLYLYIYRLFKRYLIKNNKTQQNNFLNNNQQNQQNLSYAIHITIATALLFILLAIVQIFGTITITTQQKYTKLIIEIDWLQWGYQFSIRLIEITIIWLIGWVAGLKNNINNEKSLNNNDNVNNDNSNITNFALFSCTSRINHDNYDTDYPNVCNVNINLHSYSKRTGKPLYNDNFTLNTMQNTNLSNIVDYGTIDHYENPNFELRGSSSGGGSGGIDTTKLTNHYPQQDENQIDNCYSEPLNLHDSNNSIRSSIRQQQQHYDQGYGFQNFDRSHFQNRSNYQNRTNLHGSTRNQPGVDYHYNICHHSMKNNKNLPDFDRTNFENAERQSKNSRKLRNNMGSNRNIVSDNRIMGRESQQHQYVIPSDDDIILMTNNALSERTNLINNFNNDTTIKNCDGNTQSCINGAVLATSTLSPSVSGNDENVNNATMLVADHGFVRFHPLNR